MKRDFKGIWISKDIWINKKLTLQEKVFFVEISSLDNSDGCFANNQYFSEFFGISKTRVSLIIKSLVEKGMISSNLIYKEGTKQILKRVLKVCYTPYQTNIKEPTQQKLKDNNTLSNTSNNKINKIKDFIFFTDKRKLDLFNKWLNYRKEMKKEIKVESTLRTLVKRFENESFEKCESIINNSIENGYQGLFWQNYKEPLSSNKTQETAVERLNRELGIG